MKVPLENVYYLLCYAWDHMEEGETIDLGSESFGGPVDLFARVLNQGVARLVARGLDRDYLSVREDVRGLKGKLDVGTTVKRNLLLAGKTHCGFDELSHDISQNRILKATLRQLTLASNLHPDLRREAERLYRKLDAVSDVPLSVGLFRSVRIHRNNQFYGFLLQICRVIHDNLLVNEKEGSISFVDFRDDEHRMGRLFEEFVRRFCRRETGWRVSRPTINWSGTRGSTARLPRMETDIVLQAGVRTIIIDTKFYSEPLSARFGKRRVISGHLYQIFAYVMNLTGGTVYPDDETEGWLLYAAVDRTFDYRFELMGRPFRACSIDLAQPWRGIRADLINLTSAPAAPADGAVWSEVAS